MDERDRERCEQAHARTIADRFDFIDTEIRTGHAFASVAASHYDFGQRLEARHARTEASKALDEASDKMRKARAEGHSTTHLDERLGQLRATLDGLYSRDRTPDDTGIPS